MNGGQADSPEVSSECRQVNAVQTSSDKNSVFGLEAKVGNHKRLLSRRVTGFHVRPRWLILMALDEERGWGETFDKVWVSSDEALQYLLPIALTKFLRKR